MSNDLAYVFISVHFECINNIRLLGRSEGTPLVFVQTAVYYYCSVKPLSNYSDKTVLNYYLETVFNNNRNLNRIAVPDCERQASQTKRGKLIAAENVYVRYITRAL